MVTLYAAQLLLRDYLKADVQAAWVPKSVSFNLPDTNPDSDATRTVIPHAFIILREATIDDDGAGSLCTEAVSQPVEIYLRECLPAGGPGDKSLMQKAQTLRDELGFQKALAMYHGWPMRWLGESYIDPDASELQAPNWATVRVRLRFTLEVDL